MRTVRITDSGAFENQLSIPRKYMNINTLATPSGPRADRAPHAPSSGRASAFQQPFRRLLGALAAAVSLALAVGCETSADGEKVVKLDQKKETKEGFRSLGVFRFDPTQPAKVVISNAETDGYVIVDAVQLVAE